MKALAFAIAVALSSGQASVLQVVPSQTNLDVFAGAHTAVVLFRNPGPEQYRSHLNYRVYQLSSAIAMPIGDWVAYKSLTVLPGQTILESVRFEVPAVRGRTEFEIRWADAGGLSLGVTRITAYPSNLLEQLGSRTGPLALYDPQSCIKPLLARAGVPVVDLQASNIEKITGQPIIAAVFDEAARDAQFEKRLVGTVEHGGRIVSILPSRLPTGTLLVIHSATGGRIAWATAPEFVNLDERPQAQLRLIDLVRLVTQTNVVPFQSNYESHPAH